MALGTVQSVAGYIGGIDAHNDARKAAYINDAQKIGALNEQNTQLSQQVSQNTEGNAIRFAQSFGHVAASATGLSAASSNPMFSAEAGAIGRDQATTEMNASGQRLQLQNERFQAALDRKSAIDAVPKPGITSLMTSLAGSAIGAASTYYKTGGSDLTGDLGKVAAT